MITTACAFRIEVQRWNPTYEHIKAEHYFESSELTARQEAHKRADKPRVEVCIISTREHPDAPWRELDRIEGRG